MRRLLSRVRNVAERSEVFRAFAWMTEELAARRSVGRCGQVRYELAILGSDGRGNIGDQAMLEAVWETVAGPLVILVESPQAVVIPEAQRSRIEVLVVPGLLTRPPLLRWQQSRLVWAALRSAKRFVVIGADVMDGVYSPGASVIRLTLAGLAQKHGIPSRILGFSWSERPTHTAVRGLRVAAASGVLTLPRDPQSRRRLGRHKIPTTQSADLVFSAVHATLPPEVQDASGRPYALINASGLIAQRVDLIDDYVRLVDIVRQSGLEPLLVPHVLRVGDDDLHVLRRVQARLELKTRLIERQLTPSEVRGLARHGALTITGRMHLAIMSMNMGAVPITLSTVGKVDGLYDLVGLPELVLEPVRGFSHEIEALLVGDALGRIKTWKQQIDARLPSVRSLAQENFRGLT